MADPGAPPAIGIRTAGGITVVVPGRVDLLTPYVLLEQENWFEDEIVFLCRRLAPGMRVVDIGANFGLYSLSLANSVGPTGRVWSVEPSSATAAWLRQSVDINELAQVTVIRKALSDRIGSARLSIEANYELNSLANGGGGGATEEVPLTTLDALAAECGWEGVDFLKLDAEGEEERIVAGGARFLASADPLVMFEIRHGERLNLQLVVRLAAAGYRSYRLVPGLGILVPYDAAAQVDPFQLNLFACKPGRAAMLERAGALARAAGPVPAPADVLAHHHAAHDASLDPAMRYAHLRAAYTRVNALCAGANDAYLLGTCARIARELGERQRAVDLLNQALGLCLHGDPGVPSGPFLPACAAFDKIDPRGRQAGWLKAALLDELVTLSAYSTYFAHGTALMQPTLDRLEALKATGFQRAPMERRRQLMRVRSGLQAGPLPDAGLMAHGPDNLNPELWGG